MTSDWITTAYGVPQGSVLGPLAYSVYIADFPRMMPENWGVHCYADDIQCYVSCFPEEANQIIGVINETLQSIVDWSDINGLQLNARKTQVMCIGSVNCIRKMPQCLSAILLNSEVIPLSKEVKNLGVVIDPHLSFEQHAVRKSSIGWWKLKCLWKYKNTLSPEIKWKLANALVLCHIDYCNTVYYKFLSNSVRDKLQLLQNACLRFSFLIGYRDHVTPYYRQFKILKLNERYILSFCVFLRRIISSGLPTYLCERLTRRSDIHDVDLRFVHSLSIPRHKTQKFKGSFEYTAAILHNHYTDIFSEKCSLITFKNKISCKLLELYEM